MIMPANAAGLIWISGAYPRTIDAAFDTDKQLIIDVGGRRCRSGALGATQRGDPGSGRLRHALCGQWVTANHDKNRAGGRGYPG
jgi:hypothetical protein